MSKQPADEDELVDYVPEQTEVMSGTLVILDTDAFAAAFNCIAVQVTDEGAVYVVDAETHKLRPLELDEKPKTKLSRIQ